MATPEPPPVLGLDVGNSYLSAGVLRQGSVACIANEQGARTTPAVVAFSEVECLVGDAAKAQAAAAVPHSTRAALCERPSASDKHECERAMDMSRIGDVMASAICLCPLVDIQSFAEREDNKRERMRWPSC